MKKPEIEPKCEYCQRAFLSKETGALYCEKKGVVESDDSCKKFKYDPLKRVPRKIKISCDFDEDDFKI
ncbi:MAG: hypothetical protein ACI4GY_06680 [Acutalibacteraceae bacterium]